MTDEEKFLASVIWNHFQVHAGQRMTIFNFYVVLSSLLSGATLTALQAQTQHNFTLCALGLGLAVIAFVFWRLDERNRLLIHCSEDALKILEADAWTSSAAPVTLRVFTNSDQITAAKKGHLKYSTCFRIVFAMFALFGVGIAIFATMRWIGFCR